MDRALLNLSKNTQRFLDFSLLMVFCASVFWLSDQPVLPAPMWFPHQDKVYHAGTYFIMAILSWRFFHHFVTHPILLAIVSLIFCSLYGLSDEWHQSFVPGREADIADWLADTIGAALSVLILMQIEKKRGGFSLS